MKALSSEVNGGWADKYTIAHLSAGFLLQLYGKGKIGFWPTLGIAVSWEVLEVFLKKQWPGMFEPYQSQDTWPNVATDIAAVMTGWWLGSKLPDGAWI